MQNARLGESQVGIKIAGRNINNFRYADLLSSVSSVAQSCLTLRPHKSQHSRPPRPSPTPKPVSIELVMPSNHLILCHPLLLLPPILPSIGVFSNESTLLMRWPKNWSFSFISPSNEHPGLITFRMDWLDLLAVQGTLKSLLQYHTSKASILQCSNTTLQKHQFFGTQLSSLSNSHIHT